MSSVHFSLPDWPPVIEDDAFHQKVIIWIYCVLFILILPLVMSYYYYALHKLRFLMALQPRHFKLLTFLYIIILIDFICVEPIRLLCGTYVSHISLLYWIYFILSTFSTQIIVYTLLLKIWLLFYDIKWTNVSIINDNQWRYHINNPLHEQQNKNISKQNNKIKSKHKQQHSNNESIDEEEKSNIEQLDNNIHKLDMSWFVKHRQSYGNIQYIYKYFVFIVVLSVVISLISKCLFQENINEIIINVLILIPIIIIYILWLYTPQFNDIFSLRKEMKYLLIYGLICVIINTIIDALIYSNQNNISNWIELELALTFIYHMVVFGIFMFLVCYPINTMIGLYGNRIYGTLDDDRTPSMTINEEKISYYYCFCCIALKFINKISLFDAKLTGINHTISAKESMNLQMVSSSSNNPTTTKQLQVEMTQKHKKQKRDKYKFDNIRTIDDEEESNSFDFNIDSKDEEDTHKNIGRNISIQSGEYSNEIKFIPIKQPKTNTNTNVKIDIKTFNNKFKLLQTNDGLNLFMAHCSKEFSLANILAIIELNQYEIYCRKQEKYILKQRELRKKTAKQRYKKKKENIRKRKIYKNEKIKSKKEKLKLMNRESLTFKIDDNFTNNLMSNNKRHSVKKRRKIRIKQNNLEQNIIDDDDLILDEIASKPPIDTYVSNILNYECESFSEEEEKHNEKEEEEDSDVFNYDGNAADDEEDDSDLLMDTNEKWNNLLNINDKINNLPESTIINKPFIVNSKNKRIKQLELICIALSQKYILSKSSFQLNLPKHVRNDIVTKVNKMRQNHINLKNNMKLKSKGHIYNNSNEYNSDNDSDGKLPANKLQLQYSESNYLNCYTQHYENELHMFFDHIITHILNLIDDSFDRLKDTEKYKQFINKET